MPCRSRSALSCRVYIVDGRSCAQSLRLNCPWPSGATQAPREESRERNRTIMRCRDVREFADSFLSQQLVTETNQEILWHLEICSSCRIEIDGRRRVRETLRA